MKTEKEKWDDFMQIVMDAVDVKATCESWGLEFTGSITADGWAECRAANREDNNPSAGVNLATGYYKDHGGGPSFPFFHMGAALGPYSTFHECIEGLAKEHKLLSKMPKSKRGQAFWGKLKWKKWNSLACRGLCRELKIKEEVLLMVGGTMAVSNAEEMVVVFPVYDAYFGFEATQAHKGVVIKNANGGKVTKYNGKHSRPDMLSNQSIGNAGVMNKHAIQHLHEAKVVYKVEGVSDMLALQNLIPDEYRNTHLVITNSDGCDAVDTCYGIATLLQGKNVVIIHDADEPGQFGASGSKQGGALRWTNVMSTKAKTVVNVQLPYEIAEKKGKDLRDWIEEGHSYLDLVEMVRTTPVANPVSMPKEEMEGGLNEHQMILRQLDLVVLGHSKNSAIQIFNAAVCRKFSVPDIDRFSYQKQLMHIGKNAVDKIANPLDPNAEGIDSNDVRVAIAMESSGTELSRANTVGIGIWESAGRLFAVGAGEWLAVNGGVQSYSAPMVDDKIVEFGEMEEDWYNRDLLYSYLGPAKSAEWREEHLMEMAELFGRWKNHTHPQAGLVLSCLAIATWCQSVWDWRPWVAIQGESSTGKTVLMEFIANYFGKLVCATSDASAAGIRDEIGTSGRILMYDEFEGSKYRDEIITRLMSSSRRSMFGTSVRSSSSQKSVKTEMQLIPWFSATDMKRDKQTENNRYITFELGSRNGMEQFDLPVDPEFFDMLRNKSIACIMRCWKRVQELSHIIMKSMGSSYARQGESYSLPCAVYGAICGLSDERAINFHQSLMQSLRATNVVEDDDSEQKMLMDAILESEIHIGGGVSTTIGKVLATENSQRLHGQDPEEILNRHGIRRFSTFEVQELSDWKESGGEIKSHVFFSCAKSGQIKRKLLKGTDHARQDLKTLLSRFPGAFKGRCRVQAVTRGVFIPSDAIGAVDPKDFVAAEPDFDFDSI